MKNSLALSLIGIAPLLTPILLHPSSIGTLLFHGSLGLTLVAVVLVTVILTIVKRRSVASTGSADGKSTLSRPALFLLMTAILVVLFGPFVIKDAIRYHKLTAIQQHGRRVDATVQRIYIDGCGKRDCSLSVEYAYSSPAPTPAGRGMLIGHDYLAPDRDSSNPRVGFAKTTGHVPIAYDVREPGTSALNFNDSVFRDDHQADFLRMTKAIGVVLLGILVALAAMLMLSPTRKAPELSPA